MLPIVNKETMLFDIKAENKLELLRLMVDTMDREGYLSDKELFFEDVLAREGVFSTYIDYGISIPHGKSDGVKEAGVCIARLAEPVQWSEEEDTETGFVILIAVKNQTDSNLHLKILSQLSRNLMHEDFREKITTEDREHVYEILVKEVGEK